MKLFFTNKAFRFIFLPLLFISCSSDLDFDQVDDLKLEPTLVANLAYFDVPAGQLVDNGTEQELEFDVQEFDVFRKKFFRDDLAKAELDFEIENTITRPFTIELLLLDENDQTLQTLTFQVPAYSGSTNIIKYPTEVFEGQRLVLLKQTAKIGFLVKMGAGTPLDENSSGNLRLRSSATAYMVIE